jgi:hypothetical protein
MDSAAPPSRPKELASDVLRGLLIACRAEWWAKPANHVSDEHVEDAIQLVWDHVWLWMEYVGVEWHWVDCVVFPPAAFAEGVDSRSDRRNGAWHR